MSLFAELALKVSLVMVLVVVALNQLGDQAELVSRLVVGTAGRLCSRMWYDLIARDPLSMGSTAWLYTIARRPTAQMV